MSARPVQVLRLRPGVRPPLAKQMDSKMHQPCVIIESTTLTDPTATELDGQMITWRKSVNDQFNKVLFKPLPWVEDGKLDIPEFLRG